MGMEGSTCGDPSSIRVPLTRVTSDGDGVVEHVAMPSLPFKVKDSTVRWEPLRCRALLRAVTVGIWASHDTILSNSNLLPYGLHPPSLYNTLFYTVITHLFVSFPPSNPICRCPVFSPSHSDNLQWSSRKGAIERENDVLACNARNSLPRFPQFGSLSISGFLLLLRRRLW